MKGAENLFDASNSSLSKTWRGKNYRLWSIYSCMNSRIKQMLLIFFKLDVETVKWNLFETWNVSVNYVNRCNSPWMRDYSVYFSSSIVSINVSKISCINCSIPGWSFSPRVIHAKSRLILQRIFSQITKVWMIITNEFYVERNFTISCF